MRRILFVHHVASSGGGSHTLLPFLVKTRQLGWEPLVLLPHEGPFCETLRENGIPYQVTPIAVFFFTTHGCTKPWPVNLWNFSKTAFIQRIQFQKILSQWKPSWVWISSSALIWTGLLAKFYRVPVLWYIPEMIAEKPGFLKKICTALITDCAENTLCISRLAKNQFSEEKALGNCQVIHPRVDSLKYRPCEKDPVLLRQFNLTERHRVLGIAGLIHFAKGLLQLVEAVFIVADRQPALRVLVVGSGRLMGEDKDVEAVRSLKEAVQKLRLEDRFIFAGQRKDLPDVLSVMDCLVFPSIRLDALGLSALEAAAMGKPVIVSKWAGVADYFEDGRSAYVVDARDPREIARAVCKVFQDPEKSRSMGVEARRRIEKYVSRIDHEETVMLRDILERSPHAIQV